MPVKRVVAAITALLFVSPAYPARVNPAPPSAEMLEFLGTFQTMDGRVMDPLEVEGAVQSTKKNVQTKKALTKGSKEGKTEKRKKKNKEGCYD